MAQKTYTEYKAAFSNLGLKFRLNQINDSIECNGERMTDIEALTIESKMFDLGFASAAGIRRSYSRLAGENSYHPIIEWLDSLAWDGKDHFGEFMSYMDFQHPIISKQFFKRWMLGAVGKARNQEQNFMLVMDGVQDLGKSTLSRWLIPEFMQQGYFIEGGLNPDSKDDKLRVISAFVWEVGELQGTVKKADLEALKNIITQKRVTVRKPYGHHDIDKPVLCSFIGTVNENGAGFLNDITGNRRFAIIKMLTLDHDYALKINPADIWAQINALYLAGERGRLTRQEQSEQSTINEEYNSLSHVEQYFLAYYDVDLVRWSNLWTPVHVIMTRLEDNGLAKSNQRLNQMELAGILTKLGCQKSRSGSVTGYGRAVCYSGVSPKVGVGANP